MSVPKATQARIGFATMVTIAGIAILTPTLLKMKSGEIGEEEVERPGAPLYALHAILRADVGVAGCVSERPFDLTFTVSPEGSATIDAVSGVDDDQVLKDCLIEATAAIEFPQFEGDPQTYTAPFTP